MPDSDPAFTAQATLVVLDTNVVLDLWLFGDVRSAPLRQALAAGRLTPLATAPMLAELADVLQRPFTAGWPVPPAQAMVGLQNCARLVEPPRQVHADVADALNRDVHAGQIGAPQELVRDRLDAAEDALRRERRRIARAALAERRAQDMRRQLPHHIHVGRRRARVLGRQVPPAEVV